MDGLYISISGCMASVQILFNDMASPKRLVAVMYRLIVIIYTSVYPVYG